MKKFKKIIAMGCAAVMAMSVMSMSAFAAKNESTVTEVIYTENVNSFGISEEIPVTVDIPVNATESEKNQIYLNAAYNALNKSEISLSSVNAYEEIYSETDRRIPADNGSGYNTNSLIGEFKATGSNGFALLTKNPENLSSYNISFLNTGTEKRWYDLNLKFQGTIVRFFNGKTSNTLGTTFIYTHNNNYEINMSGTKNDIYSDAECDVYLYTY